MDLSFLRAGGLTPANARVTGWPRVPVWPFLRAATAAAERERLLAALFLQAGDQLRRPPPLARERTREGFGLL